MSIQYATETVMNVALPRVRFRHHPAWLLLLVPPVAGLAFESLSSTPGRMTALLVRFLIALAPGVLMFEVNGPISGSHATRLRKELRGVMPGALLAMIVPGLLGIDGSGSTAPHATAAFVLGCLWISAAPFGGEFEQRTLAMLLSQPVPRRSLFADKLTVVIATCALASLNFLLVFGIIDRDGFTVGDAIKVLPLVAVAVCTAPYFALASRSTLAGMVFATAVPGLITVAVSFITSTIQRAVSPARPPLWLFEALLCIGGLAYVGALAVLGRRHFMHLEIDPAGGHQANASHPLSRPLDRLAARMLPHGSNSGWLMRKELRLHVVPWLVAGTAISLWLLLVLVLRPFTVDGFAHDPGGVVPAALFAGLLGTLGIIGAGASSVAEERSLGALDWQLAQPISRARLWWIKIGVAGVLGFGLSLVLPMALLWLGFPAPDLDAAFGGLPAVVFGAYVSAWLVVFAVSVFASSFARNTMGATVTAVALIAALGLAMAAAGFGISTSLDRTAQDLSAQWQASTPAMPTWIPSVQFLNWGGCLLFLACSLVIVFVLLQFAAINASVSRPRRPHVAWQCFALLTLALVIETAALFTAFHIALVRLQAIAAGFPG